MNAKKRFAVISVVLSAMLLLLAVTVVSADDGNSIAKDPVPASEPSEPDVSPIAPSAAVSMTHSLSQVIDEANSVACVNNATGFTVENSYWRLFDVANEFGVTVPVEISSVEFGVESAEATGASQPIEVRLYTVDGDFLVANLTQIGSASVDLSDMDLMKYNLPVTGTVPAGGVLAVEVYSPDGVEAGNAFFVGSNDDGQNAPSYLWSPPCGLNEPTPTGDIGFDNMHIVMNVYGDTVTPTDVSLTGLGGESTASMLWLPLLAGLLAVAAAGAFVMRRRVSG